MTPEEYVRLDGIGLAALISRGEISAVEAVEAAITCGHTGTRAGAVSARRAGP